MCYPAASWRVSDKCRKGGFMVRIKRILIAVTLIVALAVPSCAFAATETGTTTAPGTEAAVDDVDSPVGGDGIVVASSTGKVYNGKKPCFYAYYLKDGEKVKAILVTGTSADAGTYNLPVGDTGKTVTYTISKASGNKVTTTSSKSYSYKKLKKRSYSFNIGATASKSGSVKSYKSSSKYVSVSKSGKVTVKKRAKKGTYKVAVTVKLKNYKTQVKYITVRVR